MPVTQMTSLRDVENKSLWFKAPAWVLRDGHQSELMHRSWADNMRCT